MQRPRAHTTHGEERSADALAALGPWRIGPSATEVPAAAEEPPHAVNAVNAETHPDTFRTQHTTPPDLATCCVQPAVHGRAQMRVVRALLSPFLHSEAAHGGRSCGGRRRRLRRAATVAASDRARLLREMQRFDSTGGGSTAFEFHRRAQLDDELYECKVRPACPAHTGLLF